jgi:hypothetical protein
VLVLALAEWVEGNKGLCRDIASIEPLIRMKTIVGITNEVDVLGYCREVDAHVAHLSTLFTCYSGIDHFEMLQARVLKLLH